MIVLSIIFVLIIFEIVSAPIEWLLPKQLGGYTHWSGSTNQKHPAIIALRWASWVASSGIMFAAKI